MGDSRKKKNRGRKNEKGGKKRGTCGKGAEHSRFFRPSVRLRVQIAAARGRPLGIEVFPGPMTSGGQHCRLSCRVYEVLTKGCAKKNVRHPWAGSISRTMFLVAETLSSPEVEPRGATGQGSVDGFDDWPWDVASFSKNQ